MKARTQYRSSIDELVCKSGLAGSAISREMGVTVNRIIALRRANSENISRDDLAACKSAILRLGGEISYNQDGDLALIPDHLCPCRFVDSLNARIEEQSAKLEELIKRLYGGTDA
jgi:hypothetical protein